MLKLDKLLTLVLLASASLPAHAETVATLVAKPYTFTPSTPAQAAQVNADFDTIYNDYNGNITNANIKANAAISFSKLALTSQLGPILRAAGQECIGCGTTGDTLSRWGVTSSGVMHWGSGSGQHDCVFTRTGVGTLEYTNATSGWGVFNLGKAQFYNASIDTVPAVKIDGTTGVPGIDLGAGTGSALAVKLRAGAGTAQLWVVDAATGVITKPVYCSGLVLTGAAIATGVTIPVGFGGNGGDGIVTQNTSTVTGPKRYNASDLTISTGQTVTVNDGALNINSTGGILIQGNITMAISALTNGGLGGGTSSTSLTGAPGGGNGGGQTSSYTGAGGNGGSSFLFSGGAGGHNGTSGQAGFTQPPSGLLLARSGAGGGGNSIVMTATSNGGTGGSSQFPVLIASIGAISMPSGGSITVTGGAGTAGAVATTSNAAGGGAGGAASNVLAASQTSVNFASGSTFSGVGGAGGAAGRNVSGNAGGGAGGAPSSLLMWSPSNTSAGTVTLTGGAGGAAIGTGASGATPSTGTVTTITGTPNIPLITHFNNNPDKYRPYIRMIHQVARTKTVEVPHNLMCQIASEGSFVKFAKLITERGMDPATESTCLGVGDTTITEALKGAS